MKPYNPLNHIDKCDLDWTVGTIRVVQSGEHAVILMETDDGESIVLNVVKEECE